MSKNPRFFNEGSNSTSTQFRKQQIDPGKRSEMGKAIAESMRHLSEQYMTVYRMEH